MASTKNDNLPVQKCLSGEHVRNLSDTELLSVVIGSGSKGKTVFEAAAGLYYGFGGLKGLYDAGIRSIAETPGIGPVTAVKIASSLELGRRIKVLPCSGGIVDSPQKVWRLVASDFSGIDHEIFIAIVLNTKNRVLRKQIISIGTVSETVVHPREIFRNAIREGGSAVIVCHNHPSGELCPSEQDLSVTRRLLDSGKILGIPLLDHLIISENDFCSLKETTKLF